jgi:ferredoxin
MHRTLTLPLTGAAPVATPRQRRLHTVAQSRPETKETSVRTEKGIGGLGDVLGPIGLTVAGDRESSSTEKQKRSTAAGAQLLNKAADAAGVSLGPIGLTVGSDLQLSSVDSNSEGEQEDQPATRLQSIASFTNEEWRARYERDGRVDLWVQEEFNSGSRLIGGRVAHFGGVAGAGSGEGATNSSAPRHKVKIYNHYCDQEIEVEVPEDRYILYEAEDQGLTLPWACRLGCCTACAVKVKEGEVYQPQGLGISKELKEQGYALMCVGFPMTDLVLETVEEDEVYELQFGRFFEAQATDPNLPTVQRDDFAIELALGDE